MLLLSSAVKGAVINNNHQSVAGDKGVKNKNKLMEWKSQKSSASRAASYTVTHAKLHCYVSAERALPNDIWEICSGITISFSSCFTATQKASFLIEKIHLLKKNPL